MSLETRIDAIALQVFRHLLAAIPEEMGTVLRGAGFSPNIKERLDFSCALTGPDGDMVAQASHIPVHLGAVHVTGRTLVRDVAMKPGDVVCVNDPWRGGTHLPDITLFAPVFLPGATRPFLATLARAHHADVGGATPGSMGPARDVHGEGLVIPPVRLVREGVLDEDLLQVLLANTRTPDERRGDLDAQLAAVRLGVQRIEELLEREGAARLEAAILALREHAARITRSMLAALPDGQAEASLPLEEDDGAVIRVAVKKKGSSLAVDFSGTDGPIDRPFNANRAITTSAVFHVVRLLLDGEVPTNSGCLDPVAITIPPGCLLDAPRPSPVAGGNVETSQRVVDVLLLALAPLAGGRLPAPSQGTMNNLTAGGRRANGELWTFYETQGGGAGGGPTRSGENGIQSHMTNTLNTPVEALEAAYPVRVEAYELRRGSGGEGARSGGEGLERRIAFLEPADVTVLSHRRVSGAPGVLGGEAGAPGEDAVRVDGRWRALPSTGTVRLGPGDAVRVRTPGGGGHGEPDKGERPDAADES